MNPLLGDAPLRPTRTDLLSVADRSTTLLKIRTIPRCSTRARRA